MLEVFDELQNENKFPQQLKILSKACSKYPNLYKLLQIYITDESKIITPIKILGTMNHFRVERNYNMDKIGEIGEFAATRSVLLKRKEFRWRENTNKIVLTMSNVQFLIDAYNRLKRDVSHRAQYKTIKNCFVMLTQTDVKWFTRLLCRKIKVIKPMLEVIKNAEISDSM